jgi:hypothetical protein
MWETITASLKEVMESVAPILFAHGVVGITLRDVVGHTDVASQDQHVSTAVVFEI